MTADFDLAPTRQTDPEQPTPTQTAPAEQNTRGGGKKTKNEPKHPDTPTDGTLGGVIIPGAVLTGMVCLMWMIHQYGLGPVIVGLLLLAAASTAELIRRARRAAKSRVKPRLSLSNGGAGPGGGRGGKTPSLGSGGGAGGRGRGGGAGGRNIPRQNGGHGATGSLGSFGAGSGSGGRGRKRPTGPSSEKPSALTNTKTPTGVKGPTNRTPHRPGGALSKGAAALGGTGTGRSAGGTGQRRKNGGGSNSGRGLLGRMGGALTGNTGGSGHHKNSGGGGSRTHGNNNPNPNRKNTRGGTSRSLLGRILGRKHTNPTSPASKGTSRKTRKPTTSRLGKLTRIAARRNKGNKGTARIRSKYLKAKAAYTTAKSATGKARGKAAATLRKHSTQARPLARAVYRTGKKLKGRISHHTQAKIRHLASPTARFARKTSRILSPLLAQPTRSALRWFMSAHMALGTIRYVSKGPNWLRPVAKLLHAVTTPAARAVAAAASWKWLNRWMYRHSTPGAAPAAASPRPSRPAAATSQQAVNRPVPASTTGGTPVSIEPAYPLMNAADAVRAAGVLLLINPADNMAGYQAVIQQLADVQMAISEVIQAAAASTREDFKVNPAIPEAYDDTAAYARAISDRLDAIPALFRIIHAEQIENIENPTPQGAKWDISRNNEGL